MAVADLADYKAKLASPFQRLQINKVTTTIVAQALSSFWPVANGAGAAPTTAAACDKATVGAIDTLVRVSNPSADAFIAAARLSCSATSPGLLVLVDRLSHQGGLDATVTTVDLTTNLPTAALTRYTSGAGVKAGIEIYGTIGATGTTFTCKYTNQGGTGGQVSPAQAFGGTGFRVATQVMPINLAAGDTGIRSIESYTIAASTTGAGSFGLTLFKPLAMMPLIPGLMTDWNAIFGGAGSISEIVDDACLSFMVFSAAGTSGVMVGLLDLIEA